MSDKQSNLTDKEMKDLQNIVTNTLASICTMADKHNIDRDSMLKYFADMLTAFAEAASIQNYETNHTNADIIRNMSDEELAEFLDIVGEDGISSQYADVPCDCCCEKTECSKCWKDWLQSEAE
jgi:hypothetical protein|nr:MAG TPA: hypothetical protein [Bacteriophage sp.]